MARSLITGAGGFVGANLTRALVASGDEVHVIVRPNGDLWRLNDVIDKISIYPVNIENSTEVEEVFFKVKPDNVFHLAHYGGSRGQTDVDRIYKVIVDGANNVFNACKKIGTVKAIINTGSSSEYGPQSEMMSEDMKPSPNTDYGKAKLEVTILGEKLRKENQMPITTLRLFSVYGPYEAKTRLIPVVILNLMNNTAPQLSNPDAVLDLVYVEDVVEAIIVATRKPFGVYNVGTGIETSLLNIVNEIKSKLESSMELVWGGDTGRGSETVHWQADTSKAQQVLGWKAQTSFLIGIEKTINWFKESKDLYI